MKTFEEFEQCLRDTLAHLYDPVYRPPELLWTVVGCDPQQGLEAIQVAVVRAIKDLEPAPHVPPTARSWRIYGLLSCRYVQGLTQEETSDRLGITPRHLRREQPEAVYALALRLWEQSQAGTPLPADLAREEAQPPKATSPDAQWPSQVRQELASLAVSAPGTVANVEATMRSAVELGSALTSVRGISLDLGHAQPGLVAAIHPSALCQILIKGIGKLAQHMSSGQITLSAGQGEGRIKIAMTGCPATADRPPNSELMREILAVQGGSVEVGMEGDRISFWIELPSVGQVVFVVDDNMDMVHLYRRYTVGTRYHIVHVPQGQRIFETVEALTPTIIVLDIMLPDVDGWKLLAHLHEHSATSSIPVIVCSVVREQELALALGARLYLAKPVQRQEFIEALDQVLNQAPARVPIS